MTLKLIRKYIEIKIRFLSGAFLIAIAFSCSTVRYVPENSYLLNKVDVKTDNKEIDNQEVYSYIKQKENLKILGFIKFHLWLYNLSSRKKEDGWLKKIGEEPQIYNEFLTQRSFIQLKQYLHNKGYYNASITDHINKNEKRKKLNLEYDIRTGEPYRIAQIKYNIPDISLRNIFENDSSATNFKVDTPFDVDILDNERERISRLFRNQGYYNFTKDYIYYLVDSTREERKVYLDMNIRHPSPASDTDSLKAFRKYRLNHFKFNILPGSNVELKENESVTMKIDSLNWEKSTVIYSGFYRYTPRLLSRMNKMESLKFYNLKKVEETFNALNRLRQFRFIDIKFIDSGGSGDSSQLNCEINLTPFPKQSTSFDIEGTNTSGNLGIAGNLNYQHRNLFQGAEILSINLKGAMERQQAVVHSVSQDFNTQEFGIESNLSVPLLLGPGRLIKSFGEALPKTVFTVGYNFQKRPDYTRTIANYKIGYDWWTSNYLRHVTNLIDFNMVNLYNFDPDFINSIKDLYIKSSFTDHLIFATNYTLIYNTQQINARSDYSFVKFSAESAGNLFYLFSRILGARKVTLEDQDGIYSGSYYKLLNNRFAQYLKADLELRKGYMLDRYNSIVGRAFLGIGIPYGNFDVLPFEKKYFTGGANGIRAWQVRALGPGTYKAPPGSYPNQSSDIKLELNLEYRFKLINFLDGALFSDAGNIWAINDKDNREGAKFIINKFYRQLALGTGAGLRFDFNYFLFRLDLGLKLRDPSQKQNNGWIVGTRRLTSDDWNLSFAIGYPF